MMLMERVRGAIAMDHDAIEKTPFSLALISSRIGKSDYLFSLAQMFHIHDALEQACDAHDVLSPYFPEAMRRTEALARDLQYFGSDIANHVVLPETQSIAVHIHQWASENPLSLLGCIYVLEGSRMGSMVLTKPISEALGVNPADGNGIDYHVEGARETPRRLKQWKEAINLAGFDAELESSIEQTATQFMNQLCIMYAALPVGKPPALQVA